MSDQSIGQVAMGEQWAAGLRVGRYVLEDPIGSGGKAAVFRARDADGRTLAIKVLHPASLETEDAKRFVREFAAVSRMDHPNIVRVHETGELDGYPWIAMEYLGGPSLDQRIATWHKERKPERFREMEAILRGLLRALAYVHDVGLVHRDIKPSNVLIAADGTPKLSDFGVVKDPNAPGTQLTIAGRLVGTVAFMAPEQITGESVDARTDLYALGAVLYVMLTHRRPIEAASVAGYLARHLSEIPVPPSDHDPDVPRRLERICQRLLGKDPASRYPTAAAVIEALESDEDPERPPLRGRDAELGELNAALQAVIGGTGGTLGFVGSAGTGRTYLLEGALTSARALGLRSLLTLGTLRDPLRPLVHAVGEVDGERRSWLKALARHLRTGTWVIGVDDLDRASPPILDALFRLLGKLIGRERRPILLVFTASSVAGPLEGLVSGSVTGQPTNLVPITRMGRRDVITMLRDRGITGPTVPILGRRLHTELGGVPGPIDEQLRVLVTQGWLRLEGDALKPTKPNEAFAKEPLPVPPGLRASLLEELGRLEPAAQEVLQLVAVIDRPASSSFIEQCCTEPQAAGRILDRLVVAGLLVRKDDGEAEVLAFAHPSAGRVIRDAMPKPVLRRAHAAVASVLSVRRRRRGASVEVAHHLLQAGHPLEAYPMLLASARAAARSGQFSEVLALCERAKGIREACERDLDPKTAARHRRQLFLLEGEAYLARAAWERAVEPLQLAVAAAREGDPDGLPRALASLGRAFYRRGRFADATPVLEEALQVAGTGTPERGPATRALADIQLRDGNFERATALWEEALDIARRVGSKDAEARARRGMGHLRAFQGRLAEASELLDQADDLLEQHGDARVRAGILARGVELDLAAGRLGTAEYRCDSLLELARYHELAERMAEAHALRAQVAFALGERRLCDDHVRRALTFANACGPRDWNARLKSARLLCNLGKLDDAQEALPAPEDLPPNAVDDPSAQLAALRARCRVVSKPREARDLATWCLVRKPPLLVLRAVQIALDVSAALRQTGDVPGSREAIKRALKSVQGGAADGLRLELLLELQRASPDPRVLQAAGQIALRVRAASGAGAALRFAERPPVAEALRAVAE